METKTLVLGGKERRLKYDLNALAALGDRLGVKLRIGYLNEDLFDVPLPLSALRTVLWAGLLHEDPTLEELTVGGWVDLGSIKDVLPSFFGLFGATSSPQEPPSGDLVGKVDALTETITKAVTDLGVPMPTS